MLFRDADTGGKTVSASEEVTPLDIRLFSRPVQEGVGWRKDRGFGGQKGKLYGNLLYNFGLIVCISCELSIVHNLLMFTIKDYISKTDAHTPPVLPL